MLSKSHRAATVTLVLLFSLFVVLEVVPWMWSSTWTKFKYCGHGQNLALADTVCILFVAAEPHTPTVATNRLSGIGHLSKRFVANMFRAAHSFLTPDLVVFVGDFLDEETLRRRQASDWSGFDSSFLSDLFGLLQESQVLIVPGEGLAANAASQRAAAPLSVDFSVRNPTVVDHPTKMKFLDMMVWPGDQQQEQLVPSFSVADRADGELERLKAYAADPHGSVQMLLSLRSPRASADLASLLPALDPHLLISQGDGQASLRICELASPDNCFDESHNFAAGHMLQHGLRTNHSLFVNLQLPAIIVSAVCCLSKGAAGVGFAAAHIDMFGDMSAQVLWSPTPKALVFTYLLTAATSIFILARFASIRTLAAALWRVPAQLHKRLPFARLR